MTDHELRIEERSRSLEVLFDFHPITLPLKKLRFAICWNVFRSEKFGDFEHRIDYSGETLTINDDISQRSVHECSCLELGHDQRRYIYSGIICNLI